MRYFKPEPFVGVQNSRPAAKRVEMKLTWRGKAVNHSPTPGPFALRTPTRAFFPKPLSLTTTPETLLPSLTNFPAENQ